MLIGIDIGTTSLKAAAFDSRGRLVAREERTLASVVDGTGRREQDPGSIKKTLKSAIEGLRTEVGRGWREVRGIGVAAQGGSTVLVNRRTGKALTPIFLWNDTRAFPCFRNLSAAVPPRWWRSFSLRDEPGMGLARLQWIRQSRAGLFKQDPLCVGIGEFVYFLLTGQWRQDACNALQAGCYDAVRDRLSKRPLALVGLDETSFAPLRNGADCSPLNLSAAASFSLARDIPVAGPYNDHEAGYIAVRAASRRPLACALGTAWVGNFVLPPSLKGSAPFHFVIPAMTRSGRQVIMPLLTGNVTLEWALKMFIDEQPTLALERAERILNERMLPPPGLVALPWLNRPNALQPERIGSAGFFGAGPATNREDLFRAVVSSMVFEFARIFRPVIQARAVDSLVLCGGSARSRHIRSLFASVFSQVPVHWASGAELMGTRGCLYALDPQVTHVRTHTVAPGHRIDARDLAEAMRLYDEVYRRLYGSIPAGQPYSIKKRNRP